MHFGIQKDFIYIFKTTCFVRTRFNNIFVFFVIAHGYQDTFCCCKVTNVNGPTGEAWIKTRTKSFYKNVS